MTPDEIEFLKLFDTHMTVALACLHHVQYRAWWPAQELLSRAKSQGLIEDCDPRHPVVNSPGVYKAEVILTDAGRIACGLRPVNRPEKKSKCKTLFD